MSDSDLAHLAYKLLLLAAIGGYLIVQFRGRIRQGLQQALIWVLIFIGVIAAVGLWDDISRDLSRQAVFSEEGRIEVPRSPDGHYHLTLQLNGTPVEFIVDTGATDMVLSQQDAERIGLKTSDLHYFGTAQTANGTVQTAPVRLDQVSLGPFTDRNVNARVNGGAMDGSLLGMRYLERFAKLEISGNRLSLTR